MATDADARAQLRKLLAGASVSSGADQVILSFCSERETIFPSIEPIYRVPLSVTAPAQPLGMEVADVLHPENTATPAAAMSSSRPAFNIDVLLFLLFICQSRTDFRKACLSSRHRVIAAGIEGMAAGQPPDSKPAPFEKTVLFDSFISILGAGRRKAAGWRHDL